MKLKQRLKVSVLIATHTASMVPIIGWPFIRLEEALIKLFWRRA